MTDWRDDAWERFELVRGGRKVEGVRSFAGRIDLELLVHGEAFVTTEWTDEFLVYRTDP